VELVILKQVLMVITLDHWMELLIFRQVLNLMLMHQ